MFITHLNTLYYRSQNICIRFRNYSSVILPKTEFPLRVNSKSRKEKDLWIANVAAFNDLYKWQKEQSSKELFILHDGPPYANGKPHMGHALNKILKDITNRFELLSGKKIHYIPGWDCHGLPIELRALTSRSTKLSKMSSLEIRSKAKTFAMETAEFQKSAFRRWGVMADWESECYYTLNQDYISNQLKIFYELHNKGLVFRDFKPVYWSPSSKTALAESELEYKLDHISRSIYLKLRMCDQLPECLSLASPSPVHLVIWTTTPWSIPANQAVCFNENVDYCLVRTKRDADSEYLVIACELKESLEQLWSIPLETVSTFSGKALSGSSYIHPLQKTTVLPLLAADHVTMAKGTGFVHTAPAHGQDDFLVALKHRISIMNLVDENGDYNDEASPDFRGLGVFDKGQEKVLELLKNDVLHYENYKHSYPYDWRTKLPVILRASLQWFIDTNTIKNKALEAMENVTVVPSHLDKPMLIQLAKRPYWCISRQRSWGVPIPVFYENSAGREALISEDILSRVCGLIKEKGIDCWWELSPEELIGADLMNQMNLKSGQLIKGMDIMDIWFDSGVSWSSVLPENKQADLYLEGIDQFGGWFQSSLLTSVALTGRAPYKKLFVHGFALDGQGRKMSKSIGNVIDPDDIIDGDGKKKPAHGADVLRWWTASHVTRNGSSLPVSSSLIQQAAEDVQKLRSVLRFLLGNLNGISQSQLDQIRVERLSLTDQYALHLLADFTANSLMEYQDMNYKKVSSLLTEFINTKVSGFYCHLVKDRLYCHGNDSETRLGAVFVLNEILNNVLLIMAPFLPHLAEEAYHYHPLNKGNGSLFRNRKYAHLYNSRSPEIARWLEPALAVRDSVNQIIGRSNIKEWNATIRCNLQDFETLQKLQRETTSQQSALCELLQVSSVTLSLDSSCSEIKESDAPDVQQAIVRQTGDIRVTLTKSELNCCPRCRRFISADGELCSFCSNVVSKF